MSTVKFDPEVFKKSPGLPGSVGPMGAAGAGIPPLPPERYYFVIGIGVGVCAGVIAGYVLWPRDWNLLGMLQATVKAFGMGAFIGALTGMGLALVATVKDWLYQFAEWRRGRQWAQEDRDRTIAGETLKTIELSSGFRLDYVAMLIIITAWLHGERYTREAVSAADGKQDGVLKFCSPKEWNEVMATMDLIGLRTGQKLKVDELTFEQALSIWRAKVLPEAQGLRVNGALVGGKPVLAKGGKKK